jgi:peptidyl-tRNA hydrolase
MVAHAAMTFILNKLSAAQVGEFHLSEQFTPEQIRWLFELDPGIESTGQVSMAKIVCQVADERELAELEAGAKLAGLECHRVIDSGYSHNKAGEFVCIAIGPDWPEKLEPVTGGLKLYR